VTAPIKNANNTNESGLLAFITIVETPYYLNLCLNLLVTVSNREITGLELLNNVKWLQSE